MSQPRGGGHSGRAKRSEAFVAVTLALGSSSVVVSRWGDVPLGRTLGRNVTVGVAVMAVSLLTGSLIDA